MVKKTRRPSKARTYALVLSVYTATVFLSAFLLFGVQPMFTRMVLPRLGGSPSVWSVAMVFFQTMLLAGYAYAHVLTSLRNRYAAAVIHLLVLITAALTLPLSITQAWESPPITAPRRSGCSDCLSCRLVCRFLRSPPTTRCCRHGLFKRGIATRMILIFYMRLPISAVSSHCSRTQHCLSPFSRCIFRMNCGLPDFCC